MEAAKPVDVCKIGNIIAGEENDIQITPSKLRLYGRALMAEDAPEGKVEYLISDKIDSLPKEYLLIRFDMLAQLEADLRQVD